MTDTDLSTKYTRVVKTSLGQWVQAMVVKEPLAATPQIHWKGVGRMLPVRALPENVEQARRAALKDRRFFRQCERCNEVRPVSLILEAGVCMDCIHKMQAVAA
ncbi:MAG: hypothetical protein V4672_14815 [Verrucomicrobiota bacterium]|jgi:hypothetical protein|uniref:DksA C4-type domain-containing protein n=1 Tax=Prosthecobacter algae TaxID=1144682 RepID=A0ABP9PE07_9BACT|nr:hypothetical protein [Verrucomicrobiales bacterium]